MSCVSEVPGLSFHAPFREVPFTDHGDSLRGAGGIVESKDDFFGTRAQAVPVGIPSQGIVFANLWCPWMQ